jgi:hypothetical protein
MTIDLFAGIRVRDYATARVWYARVLGADPDFCPNDTEAVWKLDDHRFLYIQEDLDRPGHALHTILVDDLDARVAAIAALGPTPVLREEYPNGARKVVYRDADGNEVAFGEVPA